MRTGLAQSRLGVHAAELVAHMLCQSPARTHEVCATSSAARTPSRLCANPVCRADYAAVGSAFGSGSGGTAVRGPLRASHLLWVDVLTLRAPGALRAATLPLRALSSLGAEPPPDGRMGVRNCRHSPLCTEL